MCEDGEFSRVTGAHVPSLSSQIRAEREAHPRGGELGAELLVGSNHGDEAWLRL